MLQSTFESRLERGACGVGFVAQVSGKRSHGIVETALHALCCLEHRGATAADGESGDGAGILTQIPRRLFARELRHFGVGQVAAHEPLAVGMVFVQQARETCQTTLAAALTQHGLRVLGWRPVPVSPTALGQQARDRAPEIWQVFAVPVDGEGGEQLEGALYRAQKLFERAAVPGYICSLSARTIVYKALGAAHQVADFYRDLRDPLFESALAVYHQRYSTNTMPSWEMAQPFRMLAHNGEINTLWGNRTWMRVREAELPAELRPVLIDGESDSAALDAALVLMRRTGRGLTHALSMLVTPAWEDSGEALAADVRAFYQAHAPIIEPWDGPAALAFTDGRIVGAALDRNGLRPCRYKITDDGLVVAGSEVGIANLDDHRVVEKGRLGPGEMLAVDVRRGRVLRNNRIRRTLTRFSAQRWRAVELSPAGAEPVPVPAADVRTQRLFGLTQEEIRIVIPPMAEEAKDATWSMGDDAPIAALSRAPHSFYAFFRQRFAQVTNPPIDPLREARVMSLRTWLGSRPPLVALTAPTPLIELEHPLLPLDVLAAIRDQHEIVLAEIDCTFDVDTETLETALDRVARAAERAVSAGAGLLLLSDLGVSSKRAPIPSVLSVGRVHHTLAEQRLRARTGIMVAAGDCWDVHHVAVLIACGAAVICPWLALRLASEIDGPSGADRLLHALCAGLLKVMSKVGISTVASYRGSQHLEALGLADEVVTRCFAGMPSSIGGLCFQDIERDVRARHAHAFGLVPEALPDYGRIRFRRADEAEHHAWRPVVVRALQGSVGSIRSSRQTPEEAWQQFRELSSELPGQLRHLLTFAADRTAIPLAAVEPANRIARRFVSSAMSLGALSPEAHATLTLAMNRLGARSNSGEGGENRELYAPQADGLRLDSKIKQIASGRFGVTAEYLARAEELEIKIAQGSKPGEGGQLPGHKVTALIARLRHSQVGVPLISPPPHHDIYSIEDLSQLIYDLKRINPHAAVGVKLVAEWGVGTVAAGVAKAYADYIVISGHAGGTGASPLSSIKHAGVPWELGLAETQRTLAANGLRERVRLRTDGGLMNGRDLVIAALLGAEEYGFGTAALVSLGCDMARQCHRDSCPTGIASQRPELRAKFRGSPDHVISYFMRLAEDVRQLLAALGFACIDDAVGRADILRQSSAPAGIDLSILLGTPPTGARRCQQARNDPPGRDDQLNDRIFRDVHCNIESGTPFSGRYSIRNSDRTLGARMSGAIALRWGQDGLPADTLRISVVGSAGQSFGAFCAHGVTLTLAGEANDYVGKGLAGGKLVVRPTGAARKSPHRHVIMGNVALYGATAGELFAAGRAGERFAVRNSGATAVVEGVGDHGCEYMTGGCVVVLGRTGWNFGAGMSGGKAFVYDPKERFPRRLNTISVACARAADDDLSQIHGLLRTHVHHTGSRRARDILRNWASAAARFWTIAPAVVAPVPADPAAESSVIVV